MKLTDSDKNVKEIYSKWETAQKQLLSERTHNN